ncbi:MAG: hypothetical protein K8S54_21155 [Spirochaetia bacterium]|nr:hypothetical protein [Spirochaetia bacterium]
MRKIALLLLFLAMRSLQAAPELVVERIQVNTATGGMVVIGMRPDGYLLDAERTPTIQKYSKENPELLPVVIILYAPYNPALLDANGDPTVLLPGEFTRYLHNQCYIGSLSEYKDNSDVETQCYVKHTVQYLAGETFLYKAHEFWDSRKRFATWTDVLPWLVWFFTLVILSLPCLGITLGVIGVFRKRLTFPQPQLIVKVCLPLVLGAAWFTVFIHIQDASTWRGLLAPFRMLVPLGGIFCALAFVPITWIADHLYFPENDPPRVWIVALLYLIAPILILAAGAARGGGGFVTAPRSGGGSSSSSSTAGGGRFGGGGASARF